MGARRRHDSFTADRQNMLNWHLKGRDITDPRVLEVMMDIPREQFVPESYRPQAYSDGPLPIGSGQTISQPYIVALMTQELHVDDTCNVLEIGTGSGYQTAILARLARKVYTIERLGELSASAQKVLVELGITNVEFCVGDGSCGWAASNLPSPGGFERVMITAAVPDMPTPVTAQLADGGLLVAPVGDAGVQRLLSYHRQGDKLIERFVCDVRFVKLVGEHGFCE
jgi:protein-L-isoaspartate(D-aspartate) O-methyltransferase